MSYIHICTYRVGMMAAACKWSTPLQIPLNPLVETVLGRAPPAPTPEKTESVMLHSKLLPYMVSERHASLIFDKNLKKWMIKDLEVVTLNFMYDRRD